MSGKTVDLRSDTITLPTREMMEAMVRARLGDDVYNEDPTVNRLQELAAAKMGMEAALYVPSGTMGNTCALLAHTFPGQEVVFEEFSHMYRFESGAYANIAGLSARLVKGHHGIFRPEQLEECIEGCGARFSELRLVCIENTYNYSGGSAWTPGEVEAVSKVARRNNLKLHVDGARIFNAAVALGVDVKAYSRHLDSIMFCLSKSLSAPVGSLLCGSRAFIDRAYQMRRRLGGAMRQAGVLAAAGIVALEKMVDRLAEDHEKARLLREGLQAVEGLELSIPPVSTNMVIVDVKKLGWNSEDLIVKWKACGILGVMRPPTRCRLVAHRHTTFEEVDYVVESTRRLVCAG